MAFCPSAALLLFGRPFAMILAFLVVGTGEGREWRMGLVGLVFAKNESFFPSAQSNFSRFIKFSSVRLNPSIISRESASADHDSHFIIIHKYCNMVCFDYPPNFW
jgi:hypothetical protein